MADPDGEVTGPIRATKFTCPSCNRTSYNKNDAIEGYCGFCHDYTEARPTNIIAPVWGDEDYRAFANLFNDLTFAMPREADRISMLFSQRNMLAIALWDMGYRPPEKRR